jgi:lipoprotein NlpI
MKTPLVTVSLLAACTLAQAQPAAQPSTDAELCRSTTNAELAIKHCTAAIETRKANSEMLATWYVQRGVQWANRGDYDRAIADHNAALKLDAKVSNANYYRGAAWSNKGEFERAIEDFDVAANLKPDDPVVYHARGIELAVKGDYARAIADFDKALQLDPKGDGVHFARGRTRFYASDFTRATGDLETAFDTRPNIYTALWLYLARKRGGNEDADDLLERETRRLRGGWPSPLIALYMDRTDIASVNIAANGSDPPRRREMRCEADFYVAQSHIIKGERPRARMLFEAVQRACPKNLLEYEGTVAELRRLK